MKIKNNKLLLVGVIFLAVIAVFLFLRGFSGEDNWIKDSKGVYVKHGNPSSVPEKVQEQLIVISCAKNLYSEAKQNGMSFNSQCLGKCIDYSVDIVNNPRTAEDDKVDNQCTDFKNGITKHFVELDKNGEVVRII